MAERHAFEADRTSRTLAVVGLTLAIAVALYSYGPPAPEPADAALEEFSAGRAMAHVRALSTEPRPIGSPAHDRAVEYIVTELRALDVEPEPVESVPQEVRGEQVFLRNIIAKIPGTDNTKAILLMAHTDSVRVAPGAADDASGVATIIETVRALKTGPPLRNDLIVLLTDGEEVGLRGAKLFVERHPWAKDVGLAINFDGVGSGGPVLIPEITVANGWIITEVAEVVPGLRANSLMRDVQRAMPNDSDVTPFRNAGIPAMNVNFVGRYPSYHSALDVPERLEPGTLQHMGNYALPLAKRFCNADLTNVEAPDHVYFDVLGWWFFHYPAATAAPVFTAVLVLNTVLAVFYAVQRGHARMVGIGMAAGALLVLYAASSALAYFGIVALVELTDHVKGAEIPRNFNQHPIYWATGSYFAAFCAVTFAIAVSALALLRRRLTACELSLAGLGYCAALAVASTIALRGGSGLFTLTAMYGVISLVVIVSKPAAPLNQFQAVWLTVGAMLSIALLVPGIVLFNEAMTIRMVYLTLAFVLLLITLTMPVILLITERRAGRWTVFALSVAGLAFGYGTWTILSHAS